MERWCQRRKIWGGDAVKFSSVIVSWNGIQKVRERVNVLTGTECLTLAHSKTAHKKIWRKFHIHFPNHTIALFLKWYLIQLFHFLSSQKINKNSYRATTGVYLCILRKIVCLHIIYYLNFWNYSMNAWKQPFSRCNVFFSLTVVKEKKTDAGNSRMEKTLLSVMGLFF